MSISSLDAKNSNLPLSPNPLTIYTNDYSRLLTDSTGTGTYITFPPSNKFANPGDVYLTQIGMWVSTGSKWWLMGTDFLYPT